MNNDSVAMLHITELYARTPFLFYLNVFEELIDQKEYKIG